MYTLTAKLEELAAKFPEQQIMQIKIEGAYNTFTYKEFLSYAKNIARYLIEQGIKPQDKVAIVLENRPEWGIVYFGILFAGAIAVPLDPQASAENMKYFFEDSVCKIVITSNKWAQDLEDVNSSLPSPPKTIILQKLHILEYAATAHITLPTLSPASITSILYTSGTTGKPKGIILTHQNFYANFISINKTGFNFYNENVLSILPLHHSFPFMATLIIPLFSRCKITYLESLKSDEILQCLQEAEISILVGVPQLFYLFYKQIKSKLQARSFFIKTPIRLLMGITWLIRKTFGLNLGKIFFAKIHKTFGEKLKYFVSGGAKLDAEVAKFFLQLGFDIIEGYGLSETAPIVTFNLNKIKNLSSVGEAIPDVSMKIHKPDANGVGEIIIQGQNVMQGYHQKAKETEEALRDGWFYTGDLGYLDENGYLYITGRKKELIVLSSGKNISPDEVENHYVQSPVIKEVCILEIGKNTEQKIMAVIVPDLEYCRKNTIVDIYNSIKWEVDGFSKQLPAYKRIMGYIITKEDLPRTRLGKLQRYLIREKYLNDLIGKKAAPKITEEVIEEKDLTILASPLTQKVFTILQEAAKMDKGINLNDHLEIDLGIDSLGRVELLVALEKNLNCKMSESTLSKITTVRELVIEVANLQQQPQVITPTAITVSPWEAILKEPLPQELLAKIALKPKKAEQIGSWFFTKLIKLLFTLFWRIKVVGAENLPQDEAFILCPNHCSFLDGFAVSIAIPKWLKKKLFFLGVKVYFDIPIIKTLVKLIKVIPIDPATQLINAMQACAYVLKNGRPLCIFAEGARSIDGEVKEFRKGVGILAKELNVRLVPLYMKGTFDAWPRTRRFPRPHAITIVCGKPYSLNELREIGEHLGAKDDYEAITKGIREKVIELQNI